MSTPGCNSRREARRHRYFVLGTGLTLWTGVGVLPGGSDQAFAATFDVASGDVAGLITAMEAANANGEADVIQLEAGTYTLTVAHNAFRGTNGLPVVTSAITIVGAGAATTVIEREPGAPDFRIIAATGAGDLTLEDVTIQGGRAIGGIAQGGGGGGVFGTSGASVALHDCTITGNSSSFNGAGVLIQEDALLVLERCLVTANGPTTFGGGITVTSVGNGLTATVRDAIVTGNTCTSEKCGVDVQTADMVVVRTTISDNAGATNAGGIGIDRGLLTVIESTVTGNRAANGAGLFARDSGAIALWRSTVSGNLADNQGGGAFVAAGSSLDMIDSTVTANSAYAGGGLYGAGGARNTILAGNLHLGGGGADCVGSVVSSGSNLIQATSGCAISGATGSDITGVAPGVNALADNGGPTETHALAPGSPAIDHGAGCSGTDQRGYPRPVDGDGDGTSTCDIGAYERAPCGNGVLDPGEACDDGNTSGGDGCEITCTPTGCGDDVVAGAEECDDGNIVSGDCCSSGCRFEAGGSSCPDADGNACTIDPHCDGAGACVQDHAPSGAACADDELCTIDECDGTGTCLHLAVPDSSCRAPTRSGRGIVKLRGNRISWKWVKGEETPFAAFGTPELNTDYAVCVFDASGAPQPLMAARAPAGGTCTLGNPCWARKTTARIEYNDLLLGSPDGITQIRLKSGIDGKASVLVRGLDPSFGFPAPPLIPPVTVQLRAENGECWGAVYSTPRVNDTTQFKANPD